jgi:hypothetical protein
MKKIYISGAISGLDPEVVKQKFGEAEDRLQNQGWQTVNPLKNGLPAESTWEQHMGKDIELLLGCDAIAMLPGFSKSRGAKIELAVAREIGIEVIIVRKQPV